MRTVYTDGACSGNPGPGGLGLGGDRRGLERERVRGRQHQPAHGGGRGDLRGRDLRRSAADLLEDSTYVVNCWKDRWWAGWLKRGWKNSQRKPVANRDLWERLVPRQGSDDLELLWVEGHSGDRWNDIADRLAVAAVQNRRGLLWLRSAHRG
ncbi:MAG: RNase H family protein [Microthrixaceae bacterium]